MGIDKKNVDLLQAIPDDETGLAAEHFVVARIIYPAEKENERAGIREGLLVLIKPNFTGDEPIDLQSYRAHQPHFPHHPTTDQFYDPDRFESYRQLGFHIGAKVCDELIRNMRRAKGSGNPLADNNLFRPSSPSEPRDHDLSQELPDELTEESLRAVLESLTSEDPERRELAAHFIGENAPLDNNDRPAVIEALYESVVGCHDNNALREKVLWAMGELSSP